MTNANPSVNPADLDSLTGVFRLVFTKLMQTMDGRLPAEVIAYDDVTNLAQIQPLIAVLTTDGEQVKRAQIASVPVYRMGGGGFFLKTWLQPGDLGWIEACDRDISLFMQSFKESRPNTRRIKNFADSVFYPSVMKGVTVAPEDKENMVLQSLDGTVKISLGVDKITIQAPEIECVATTRIKMTTPLLAVDGNITATGDITPHVPP